MRPFAILACLILPSLAVAEPVDYLREVKPIFKERCFACHGPLKQKAKLRLDTVASMRKSAVIEPGHPEKSVLFERAAAGDETLRMPPEGKPLSEAQIAVIKRWLAEGALGPPDEKPEEDPRQHWAFQRVVSPTVPTITDTRWVKNPIDAFIAAGHAKHGLQPAPEADRATLLRRVYLDLVGLPPTREELHAFLADSSTDGYEKVVERLLASPRYGERWARHWMDIWRYSDWYGSRHINELRYSRRHIWRWRDWIIEALEQDKGYDRVIVEMLAADELAPGDLDMQRASGYLGRNFYVFNRNVWLQETVEYTTAGLLGLTFKCCRCHDHKYDPLAQEDYYRFRAFFEPHRVRTDPIAGKREPLKGNIAMGSPPGSNWKEGHDCIYDADLAEPTYLFERGDEKSPIKDKPLAPGVPAFLGRELRIEPVRLPWTAFYPELRPEHRAEMLSEANAPTRRAEAELAQARTALTEAMLAEPGLEFIANLARSARRVDRAGKLAGAARAQLHSLESRLAADLSRYAQPGDPRGDALARAASQAERQAAVAQADADLALAEEQLAAAQLAARPGDAKTTQAVAAGAKHVTDVRTRLAQNRKALTEMTAAYTPLGTAYPATSSGRRLALARWIASRDNPLTARVAVNHIWLRHMGTALVPSVHNFGLNGKRPTHPELLDWLAVTFMDSGWSMKTLHRLIVTSSTYRLSSDGEPRAADPENRYLWRANVRRMEAEVVRDSLLHLAGGLDPTRGGEDLDPTKDTAIPRRSLYFRHTPDEKPLMLELFDAANPSECFERTESIVPQQALALANSEFSHAQARLIARRLDAGRRLSDGEVVTAAFEHLLGRAPVADERTKCEVFLQRKAASTSRARENLVHVLLNYNEFVTIR